MPCTSIANLNVVRITRVDRCGRPVCGDNNAVVSDCVASLQMEAIINEPDEIRLDAANGKNCLLRQPCPSFDGFNVTYQFYSASPEMVEILTGNPAIFDAQGNPVGWDDVAIRCRAGFAIEAWSDVGDDVECPDDAADAEGVWFYSLLPWVTNGRLGDLTLNNEGVTFTLTGRARRGSRWADGPWGVQRDANGDPGPMLQPITTDTYRRMMLVTVPPPADEDCEYLPVECESPSPESPA